METIQKIFEYLASGEVEATTEQVAQKTLVGIEKTRYLLGQMFIQGFVSYRDAGGYRYYRIAITDNQMSAFRDEVTNDISKVVCEHALGIAGKKRSLECWRQVANHMKFMGTSPSYWEEKRQKEIRDVGNSKRLPRQRNNANSKG